MACGSEPYSLDSDLDPRLLAAGAQRRINELEAELKKVGRVLGQVAGMVHQAHLFVRVNGLPGENTLNKLDHEIERLVKSVL